MLAGAVRGWRSTCSVSAIRRHGARTFDDVIETCASWRDGRCDATARATVHTPETRPSTAPPPTRRPMRRAPRTLGPGPWRRPRGPVGRVVCPAVPPAIGDPPTRSWPPPARCSASGASRGTTMSQIAGGGRAAAVVALLLLPQQGGDPRGDRRRGERGPARADRPGRAPSRRAPAVRLYRFVARRRRGPVRAAVRHQRGPPLRRPRPRALRRVLDGAPHAAATTGRRSSARASATASSATVDARLDRADDHVQRRGGAELVSATTSGRRATRPRSGASWPTSPSAACCADAGRPRPRSAPRRPERAVDDAADRRTFEACIETYAVRSRPGNDAETERPVPSRAAGRSRRTARSGGLRCTHGGGAHRSSARRRAGGVAAGRCGRGGDGADGASAAGVGSRRRRRRRCTIGYSAWPGWFPLAVAEEQGIFEEAGLDVELKYFADYIASLDALVGRQLDVNAQTLNDTIFAVAAGSDQRIVVTNDNSTGNDAVICDAVDHLDRRPEGQDDRRRGRRRRPLPAAPGPGRRRA